MPGAGIMCGMDNGAEKSGGPTADCRGVWYQGIRVAIDGPAASGKSTVGRAAAQRLGLRFLDTGIMYRAVTWLVLRRKVAVDDADAVAELARRCPISICSGCGCGDISDGAGLSIAGHTPGGALWAAAVDAAVSAVSAAPGVRTELVRQQRAIGNAGGQAGGPAGGIVMVGRDIGSVVLPDAEVKLYITASAEERARRRMAQRRTADGDTGVVADSAASPDFDRVLADTRRRDSLDSGRAVAPLTIAAGATVISTDGLTLEQSVAAVLDAVRAAVAASISESASKPTASTGEG